MVLTGTDLYRDLDHDPRARHSLECASRVVVLQEEALRRLDAATRAKAVVIVQSARALRASRGPDDPEFVAVGHLRSEKDPETLLRAVRLLGAQGHAPRVDHVGAALDEKLGDAARATAAACPGYRWLGGLAHGAARRAIARARALVHPSVMEGGANVVIEAVRSGVPVLASRIDGNVGLLGAGYDGFFPVGDSVALAALMRRFLADAAFAGAPRGAMRGARAAVPSRRASGARCAHWSSTSCRHGRTRAETIVAPEDRRHDCRHRPRMRPSRQRAASPHELFPRRRLRLQDRARACSPRSCARAPAASCRRS